MNSKENANMLTEAFQLIHSLGNVSAEGEEIFRLLLSKFQLDNTKAKVVNELMCTLILVGGHHL